MRWVCTRTFAASAGAAVANARAAKSATSVRPAGAIPPKADLFPAMRPRFPGSVAGPEIRTCDAQMTRTLAGSKARFKVVCSPCSLFYADNARDGNWSTGFNAERDLILELIPAKLGRGW